VRTKCIAELRGLVGTGGGGWGGGFQWAKFCMETCPSIGLSLKSSILFILKAHDNHHRRHVYSVAIACRNTDRFDDMT